MHTLLSAGTYMGISPSSIKSEGKFCCPASFLLSMIQMRGDGTSDGSRNGDDEVEA